MQEVIYVILHDWDNVTIEPKEYLEGYELVIPWEDSGQTRFILWFDNFKKARNIYPDIYDFLDGVKIAVHPPYCDSNHIASIFAEVLPNNNLEMLITFQWESKDGKVGQDRARFTYSGAYTICWKDEKGRKDNG